MKPESPPDFLVSCHRYGKVYYRRRPERYQDACTAVQQLQRERMPALGADLYTMSKLLGYSNVKTTQTYAKIVDSKKVEAVNLVVKNLGSQSKSIPLYQN